MKRQALVKKIRRAAKAESIRWELVREGKRHEIWACGFSEVSIPRHTEINDLTAESIFKDLQGELGEGWWR